MGYTEDDSMVRVDFFKPSGKWYTTEAVQWIGYDANILIYEAFALSLFLHLHKDGTLRLSEMNAICLEPYHIHAFPLCKQVSHVRQNLLELLDCPNRQFYDAMPESFRKALESINRQDLEDLECPTSK